MKILHLINYTGGGGTESYIYSLARELHPTRCEFFIAYGEKGASFNKFKDLGITMIHLPMSSPYDLKASKKLKEICKKNKIDVIHTHFLRENYISIISKFLGNRVKLINTRHMLDKNTGKVRLANRFMTRFNSNIIAVSQAVKSLLIEELSREDNIDLIYTGVDLNQWEGKKGNFRKEFNLGNDTLLITSTARFSKEKGHKFLLDSIYTMEKSLDKPSLDYRFVLVGEGRLLDNTKSYARELGIYDRLIFTGYREDIPNILLSSDIFVSMSKTEAFGISILEGLAASLPVISTDSGGTREIIEDKNTGILVDYGDTKAMAGGMAQLINDKTLRDSYSKKSFDLVKNKFSIEETARKTYDLYIK